MGTPAASYEYAGASENILTHQEPGFLEVFPGTSFTCFFWIAIAVWAGWQLRCHRRTGRFNSVGSLGGGLVLGTMFGLAQFALGISAVANRLTQVGAYDPSRTVLDLRYIAFCTLWILLGAVVAVLLVGVVASARGKKPSDPVTNTVPIKGASIP